MTEKNQPPHLSLDLRAYDERNMRIAFLLRRMGANPPLSRCLNIEQSFSLRVSGVVAPSALTLCQSLLQNAYQAPAIWPKKGIITSGFEPLSVNISNLTCKKPLSRVIVAKISGISLEWEPKGTRSFLLPAPSPAHFGTSSI